MVPLVLLLILKGTLSKPPSEWYMGYWWPRTVPELRLD